MVNFIIFWTSNLNYCTWISTIAVAGGRYVELGISPSLRLVLCQYLCDTHGGATKHKDLGLPESMLRHHMITWCICKLWLCAADEWCMCDNTWCFRVFLEFVWHLLVPLSTIILNVPLLLFAWFQITSPRFKHDGTGVQGNVLLQTKFIVTI